MDDSQKDLTKATWRVALIMQAKPSGFLLPKLNPAAEPSSAAPRRSGTSHQHGRKRAIFVFAALLLLTGRNARAQDPVEADRAALEALYNATGGATWTDNTNWLSAEALSEWHGVSTDGIGRVTDLYLTDNNLSGEIPAELGALTSLQSLFLEDNNLSGEIPAELGDLMREGVLRDYASIPLEANGQTSWLIDQEFPAADTSDFAGSVRCDAVGEGRFAAVALEMDPATRTFTTLPVFPVPERTDRE